MRMPLVVSIPCCQDSVIVLSAMLFVLVILFIKESQASIQFLYLEMDVNASKLYNFARLVVTIVPRFSLLSIALPDLDTWRILIHQHNLLNCWTLLISAKLHTAIPPLRARR